MAIDFQELIKIDAIENEWTLKNSIQLQMLRLDQIHPVVSGNKWFKLKYNIADAIAKGCSSLLTFGGAYSNHLIATAAAAKAFGLSSIGIVRGLHAKEKFTETLHACENMGMQLHFIERASYDKKEEPYFLQSLKSQFPDSYVVPEGGNNESGRRGTAEIATYIQDKYSHVALAIGTGATFAGIREALDNNIDMLGFTVMKGGDYLNDTIRNALTTSNANWSIVPEYHFGGFAKCNELLIDFMNQFYENHQIPLDLVYNAKMMFGVMEMIKDGRISQGSKVLCIHTGGLQGNQTVSDEINF